MEEGNIMPLLENIVCATPLMTIEPEEKMEEQGMMQLGLGPQEAEIMMGDDNQAMHEDEQGGMETMAR